MEIEGLKEFMFLNNNLPDLKIGDYIYKLTYNNINFHIDKLKIIDIEDVKSDNLLIGYYKECICENDFKFRLRDINLDIMLYEEFWVFSSLDKCKKYIKDFIEYNINNINSAISYYEYQLEFWKRKLKTYNKNL